ncbi:hypothetical protein EVA_08935 [gut metagenome]|uniref:Uncharacterized protein n=1 Tax=gut metagenome TaxID=749906 RepID=J9G6T0_9ZZZZ
MQMKVKRLILKKSCNDYLKMAMNLRAVGLNTYQN